MSRLPTSIEFAKEVPSGRSTSVRAQLDTATGGGAIGRALQGLGAVLSDIGFDKLQKAQDAQDAIELSAKKLEVSDIMTLGINNAKTSPTQVEATAVFDAAKKRVSELTTDSARVDTALKVHVNGILATHNRQFANDSLERTRRDVIAGAESNMQSFLEKGQIVNAEAQLIHLRTFNMISAETLKKRTEELPVDALLAQAGIVAGTDPDAALKLLSKIKDPTGPQVKLKESIESRARSAQNRIRQQLKFDANKAITDAVFQLSDIQEKELPPNELDIALDQVEGELRANSALTTSEARIFTARIDNIRRGGDVVTDRTIQQQAMAQIRLLNTESSREQIAGVKQFVVDNQSNLSTNDSRDALDAIDKRLNKDKAQAIDSSVAIAIQRGQITKGFDDANFTVQLKTWADTHADATAKEIRDQGGNIAADFKKTPPQIFTPARIQRTLGELTAKSWIDFRGFPITLNKGSNAITHVLRTLGPNWQRIAPDAAGIIRKNWPGTAIPKLDVVPGPPEGVPLDGTWDTIRQQWKWIRKTKAHPQGELFVWSAE